MDLTYTPGKYIIPEIRLGRVSISNLEISVFSQTPFPKEYINVGIIGSGGGEKDASGYEFIPTQEQKLLGRMIGEIVAARKSNLGNGALLGLPYFPPREAHKSGAYTFGISAYISETSHREKSPLKNPDSKERHDSLKYLDLAAYFGLDSESRYTFLFRDLINTGIFDVAVSMNGRWGTLDEASHVLDQGGILVLLKGTGGATDIIVKAIENREIIKNNGAKVFITKNLEHVSLEEAINNAIDEAERRWKHEGRYHNKFTPIADKVEELMLGKTIIEPCIIKFG